MTAAYTIGNITVKDEKKWAEYRSKVPATLIPWGGELVFRGETAEVFSGEYPHTDVVVIRFPSMDALNNWYKSEEYQAIISIREQGADIDLVTYKTDG